ncbi:MAG: HD-GYP domain-containing protein [Lachnospiraceae bacterium]|nr:HD-GYP domain-containing protein [Lachnospiraceae bacterium]
MKRYLTSQLRPGMVLGESIYSLEQDRVVLEKGTVLDERAITRLKLQIAIAVLIDEDETPEEEASVPDREPSHAEKLRATPEFQQFKQDFEETFSDFGNKLNDVVTAGADLEPEELSAPVMDLIENTTGPSGLFDMLHSLRQYSDETYAHSVNVALISNAIGQWMNLPPADLQVLTQAGLLHDIGKLLVPRDIITKPGRLTEEEYRIIQQHAQKGYELVKDRDLDPRIKNAILMHHERCDGSGYPSHLETEAIDPFARYVAIADVYDAITSARVYRDALCPFIAVEIMESEGLQKYDPQAILTFLTNVVNVYLFNRVRLSDGREGEVVFINRQHFARPTVRTGNEFVDLARETELSIEAII